MIQRILLTIMFGLGLAPQARASCECRCVDGEMRALCSSSIEIAPICPAVACGIPPAAIAPIKPLRIAPLGTSQCTQRQVLNPDTHQYEWRRLCQ